MEESTNADKARTHIRGNFEVILSPKRPHREVEAAVDIFPYYAGYSYAWAAQMIAEMRDDGLLLDPWNGSGTSTLAAANSNRPSVGVDLNPAVNIVAKARLVGPAETDEVDPPPLSTSQVWSDDPLRLWMGPHAVARVRDWTQVARSLTPGPRHALLVATFHAVRQVTKTFEGSNPTWVRIAGPSQEAIEIDPLDLDHAVQIAHKRVRSMLQNDLGTSAHIVHGSSTRLPLANSSIDCVIGSPPYLTRIDYAVAYSRELAVLGLSSRRSSLRRQLMGTTMIRAADDRLMNASSVLVTDLLADIAQHESKDSSGYYLKQATQYFEDLEQSLQEITRVARAGAEIRLVVQDSYYKDVHIDLAEVCEGMLKHFGWESGAITTYAVPRLVTTMNTGARGYIRGNVKEKLLVMRRAEK